MKVKLGDVCEINPKVDKLPNDTQVSFIPMQNVTDDGKVDSSTIRTVEEVKKGFTSFRENDVLFAKITPCMENGKGGIARNLKNGFGFGSTEFHVLRPSSSVTSEWLYYLLSWPVFRKECEKNMTGSAGQKRVPKSFLENYTLRVPPLDEQRRIAAVLDKVSDLIAKRREQLDKLDELVKARFVEMFGDETETGRWPSCTIADIADVCVGVVIKPTQYYTNNGIPAFRSLNIGEMCVKDDEWVYFTKEGHQKNQKSIVRQNDVLVVRSGAPGTACVVTEQYDGYNAVDIIIAHPDNTKINSTFLAEFTNMPHGKNQIRERTGGAAQQHFNVSGYKALHLIMPPMCQQEEFASFFEQTNKSKLTIQQSLDKMETLKKALMQEYFG